MDSKQLHRKFYNKFDLAKWFNEKNELVDENEVEYQYCGTKEDFRKEFVYQEIEKYYSDDKIYLIITSGNSSLVSKSEIVDRIEKFIGKKEIGVMDKSFTKLVFFNSYGTYKKGVVIDYPKSRTRKDRIPLKVAFHANMYDASTQRVAKAVQEPLEQLGKKLSNDYAGNMEHLWIDLELVESYLVNRKPYLFRFQKKVNIASSVGGKDYYYNVGHFSVAPDFDKLKVFPDDLVCDYILTLMYQSTQVLIDNQKKLDNFDTIKFRSDFVKSCNEMGYLLI
ncbi:hypothetical protein AAG747_19240 [Rapidithrix thailandica]|uniref:Uncharacterized protein n=1 Tax=Rapidithrix thailandica TaxID=413964 RepID=A0AAW9SAT5_9BACT